MQIPIWKVQFKKYLSKTSLATYFLANYLLSFFFFILSYFIIYTQLLLALSLNSPLKVVGKSTWVKESKPLAANTGITIPGRKKQHSPNVILKTGGNL